MTARRSKRADRAGRSRKGDRAADEGAPSPGNVTYFSDEPIKAQPEDRFKLWPFARRLAEAAGRTDSSGFVIGVYGKWGQGKTSALNLMASALEEAPHVVAARFNPWVFSRTADLVPAFFTMLAEILGRSTTTAREKIGRVLGDYIGPIAGTLKAGAGEAAAKFGSRLTSISLEDRRRRVEKMLLESGRRVVVLVDDVDRLDVVETCAVLKLVRLTADFPNITYVLAFDDERVSAALGRDYGNASPEAGRQFLEKIVQVQLHLPIADGFELRRLLSEQIDAVLRSAGLNLSEDDSQSFGRHFVEGLSPRVKTPRQAKLYANALQFALPLMRGEVNVKDQMLIEGLRVFYPEVYLGVRASPELFVGTLTLEREEEVRKRTTEALDLLLADLGKRERAATRGLLEGLFPQLVNRDISGESYARWAREKRVCVQEYFPRYFRYTVPEQDVSDRDVEALLRRVPSLSVEDVATGLRDLSTGEGRAERLIQKLRLVEDDVGPLVASRVALAVAQAGDSFAGTRSPPFRFISDREQAAILVMKLLCRLPEQERPELARRIVVSATPLPFAVDCAAWLMTSKDKPEEKRILPEDVEKEILEILARRIARAAEAKPPYVEFPGDGDRLLWTWRRHGSESEVSSYLTQRLRTQPAEVVALLDCFLPTAWAAESGVPIRNPDLPRERYNDLVALVPAETVMESVRSVYGPEIEKAEYYGNRDASRQEKAARQFAHHYRKTQESGQDPSADPPGGDG